MNTIIEKITYHGTNSYLIKYKNKFILIDAGYPRLTKKLKIKLMKTNNLIEDISLIIITHSHKDHVGGLKKIKELSKAKIIIHQNGKQNLIKGTSTFPAGTNFTGNILKKLAYSFFSSKFKSIKPDITYEDVYDLHKYGINGKIVHTPGHTDDSSCIIIENNHCFVGDSLFNLPFSRTNYPIVANDEDKLINSIKLLQNTGCKYFYPGHGKIFKEINLKKNI